MKWENCQHLYIYDIEEEQYIHVETVVRTKENINLQDITYI